MEQFLYYLKVTRISIKRAPLPYFLTILIMSLGLGVFFANATFYYWLKHDPLAGKSAQLFHPRINSIPNQCSTSCNAPRVLSYRDIKALTDTQL
jgi:putative ABC transport system permease protein